MFKRIGFFVFIITILAVLLAGCGNQQEKTGVLKIGATPVPHAEILEQVKPLLEKEGIKLEIVQFTDYVKPNMALADKEIDANFFQHLPYLEDFIKERKLELVSAGSVHVEPMGVYSQRIKKLDQVKKGTLIAIPNDPSNGGRALLLLEKAGLLKLKDGVGVNATVNDIVANTKGLQFKEMEAAQLPRVLPDVDLAVINTNYALEAKLNPLKDALFIEDKESPYANIVVVRKGDEERPEIKKLIQALQSPEIKKFILDKYQGAVVPAF